MRREGTIKTWNDARGFGFIKSAQDGQEIFLHIKAFAPQSGRPQVNQLVSFEIEAGSQGKKRATNVAPVGAVDSPLRHGGRGFERRGWLTLIVIPVFLLVYAVVHALWKPPLIVAAIYAAVSMLTFVAYALDKSAAGRGNWRTSESTLHTLALGCGWPGALLAQQVLRHKTKKRGFRFVFWGTVVLNVAGFIFLSSPLGRSLWDMP